MDMKKLKKLDDIKKNSNFKKDNRNQKSKNYANMLTIKNL